MRTIWQESVLEIKIIKELMISFLSFFFTMVPIFSSVILLLINSILEFGPLNFMLVSSNKLANESLSEMTGTPQREQPPSGGGGGGWIHIPVCDVFFHPISRLANGGGKAEMCLYFNMQRRWKTTWNGTRQDPRRYSNSGIQGRSSASRSSELARY